MQTALRRIAMAIGAAAVVGGMLVPGKLAIADSRKPANELASARAATDKYHDVERARRDGFVLLGECIGNSAAAVGYHYVNLKYVLDRQIDPAKPEILLYIPDHVTGGLRLVGLEYFKRDLDQDLATKDDRPELFGHPFPDPIVGRTADQPIHYELHVWLWQNNPEGMFVHYNKLVRC